MSRTPRAPFADVQVSLDNAKRAWIKELLTALGNAQPLASTSGAVSAQSTGQAPLLQGGVPVGPYANLPEQSQNWDGVDPNQKKQQDAVKQAYEKIEANKQANKQEDKPWSFEDALKNRDKDLPPVFQFPNRKPPILGPDEHLGVNDNDYEKLPKNLKRKMSYPVWQKIKGQRATLLTIYLRLSEYGAWDAVSKVKGIKEQLPWHGQIGLLKFGVYGTGGIAFEEEKMGGLMHILNRSNNFGSDNKIMSFFHAGQQSNREYRDEPKIPPGVLDNSLHEWSEKDPTPSSSLHISVGPGIEFDAHIDRISPVMKPQDGHSVPKFPDSLKHIRDEVLGPAAKILGIPKPEGVKPDFTREKVPNSQGGDRKVNTVWLKFEIEWDFPSTNKPKKKTVVNKHTPRPEPLPADVQKSIREKVGQISLRFPQTSEGDVDAGILAEFIAGRILAAAKIKEKSIGVDFPNYSDTKLTDAEQKIVHNAVQELGNIVRSALGPQAGSVKNVTVYLPAQKALNVPLKR